MNQELLAKLVRTSAFAPKLGDLRCTTRCLSSILSKHQAFFAQFIPQLSVKVEHLNYNIGSYLLAWSGYSSIQGIAGGKGDRALICHQKW
ncbi:MULTISPECIES: hypothetical protein [Cyanophyceae]|uniref:hypothetical protein n=1 Tax=Cyanophyceae TaxID=3028117 RepID=UPI001682FCCE|nr:hypothetical protein [Trichocoleus sp. FACHB-69]MBD1930608.1 hypothetical protein [Trichocoleus sp. FACHB-69]